MLFRSFQNLYHSKIYCKNSFNHAILTIIYNLPGLYGAINILKNHKSLILWKIKNYLNLYKCQAQSPVSLKK